MKKIMLIVILICTVILMSLLVLSGCAATDDGKLDSKPETNVIGTVNEQIVTSVDHSEEVILSADKREELAECFKYLGEALTDEQLLKLDELYISQNVVPAWGRLPYQERIIIGEIDPNAPKLDLATAKDIIAKCNDFEEILSEFDKVQKYPDFVGGSGVSLLEYQLSEYEKISIIIEQRDIAYLVYNSDGTAKSTEILFE